MRGIVRPLLALSAIAPMSAAIAQFTNTHLSESTAGRVGYHMSVGIFSVYEYDLPKGNKGGAMSGTCQMGWWNPAYSGELPPGIAFTAGQGSNTLFSGTPRQPGSWRGTFSFELGCTGGPDTNRYQRSIPVVFQIEP